MRTMQLLLIVKIAPLFPFFGRTRLLFHVASSIGVQLSSQCHSLSTCLPRWVQLVLTDSDYHLALRRCVGEPLDLLRALVEYPRYTIGFREDRAVAYTETETEADSEVCTIPRGRFAQYDEAHAIAGENSHQQNVT